MQPLAERQSSVRPGGRPQIVRSPQCRPWASIATPSNSEPRPEHSALLPGSCATVLVSMPARGEHEVRGHARLDSPSFSCGHQPTDGVAACVPMPGSEPAAGGAAALPLAGSDRLASTGRDRGHRGVLAVALRASRARQTSPRHDRDIRHGISAGLVSDSITSSRATVSNAGSRLLRSRQGRRVAHRPAACPPSGRRTSGRRV